MELKNETCVPQTTNPFVNLMDPQESCSDDFFRCTDGYCIPIGSKCDGRNDCYDGSDEKNCLEKCTQAEFSCDNGTCISVMFRCDNYYDCVDKSDEQDCSPCESK